MAKNKLDDLRDHLFETIEALKDEENPMDLDRAKAVGEIADVIISSAKAEVEMLRVSGKALPSTFWGRSIEGVPEAERANRQLKGTP